MKEKKKILWKLPVFIWLSLQRSVEFYSWVAKSKGKIREEFYLSWEIQCPSLVDVFDPVLVKLLSILIDIR